MTRSRFAVCLVAALTICMWTPQALSQTPPGPPGIGVPDSVKNLKLGNVCRSAKLTGGAGVIKVDLCGRAYCGSTSVNEPFQKIDYDRKRMPCEFKMVDNRCRCVGKGNQ